MLWQRGPYQSWWLRLGVGHRPLPSYATLAGAVDEAIRRAAAVTGGAAVYVGVHELETDSVFLGLLRARGFRYHHYQKPEVGGAHSDWHTGEFIYYRWMGDQGHDMVPSYATSIEGVSALYLSPDESKVLLIWEYGNWKFVTGAVDEAESSLGSLIRELSEEVGGAVDPAFAPRYVGGWQLSAARDRLVNDNFSVYAVRAATEDFAIDHAEVVAARWFSIAELLQLWQRSGRPPVGQSMTIDPLGDDPSTAELKAAGRMKISTNAINWLAAFKDGNSLPVLAADNPHEKPSSRVWIGGPDPAP